jgi:hypothetical protein
MKASGAKVQAILGILATASFLVFVLTLPSGPPVSQTQLLIPKGAEISLPGCGVTFQVNVTERAELSGLLWSSGPVWLYVLSYVLTPGLPCPAVPGHSYPIPTMIINGTAQVQPPATPQLTKGTWYVTFYPITPEDITALSALSAVSD